MNITEDKSAAQLHVMLMSSSPGILDGDEYELKIEVGQHCSLQLHTQAYQRLFHMKSGALQQMQVYLEEAASFCYLPHPSAPHELSIFKSQNYFYLRNQCCFVFGEILTCGRKFNGELFSFSKYQSISNIYIDNKLVIKENLLMQPSMMNVHAIGQLEGYSHQASMIYLKEDADMKNIQMQVMELLATENTIDAGITAAPVNGLIIRLLGNGAEQLYDCLQRINVILQTHKTLQYAS
jgi:urease accessory protein